MVDPNERERTALQAGLRLMAEIMAEVGWTRRLNELTDVEAQRLAEAAVDGFQDAMRESAPRLEPEVPFP
jgi:Family of unknown function (DUF6511)